MSPVAERAEATGRGLGLAGVFDFGAARKPAIVSETNAGHSGISVHWLRSQAAKLRGQ
ncbi:hypothetical protein IV500_05100 [Paeniglutamicibacter antarcticus]|uniref:Uncharacterized protein n=1 Tax=Arthrobacter terrae TaxID=2935737 RepID=A0A931CPU3_9MICC|nr:hypothetical protein [Arthrobacter terrae]MBG0738796.1 hypothetical protein [Arthrobacter terrae]